MVALCRRHGFEPRWAASGRRGAGQALL